MTEMTAKFILSELL